MSIINIEEARLREIVENAILDNTWHEDEKDGQMVVEKYFESLKDSIIAQAKRESSDDVGDEYDKRHYWLVSISGIINGSWSMNNLDVNTPTKNITKEFTKETLEFSQRENGYSDCTISSINYMGYMSKSEYNQKPESDKPESKGEG